ncbi:MAG: sensor histidine kinase [Planctomycetota bacterium]
MRTRSRLLASYLGLFLVFALVAGTTAWFFLDGLLERRARDSAERVAAVLVEGGFSLNERNLRLMKQLTGFEFRLVDAGLAHPAGQVVAPIARGAHAGREIVIDYRNQAHAQVARSVLLAALVFTGAGIAAFAAASWWIARRLARPLERLGHDAQRIGEGELERAVTPVGGGEIRDLALNLESMRARLSELDRANRMAERLATLGTFTATIAHEVRNPLSAVRLTVQMLARQLPDEQRLPMILDELQRLDLIVDELLAYSRGMNVEPVACDLAAIAADVCRLLRRQAEHAGVVLEIDGAARAQADPARMRQLLINLILNAIQVQHGGGRVAIAVRADGFAVRDEGPGIAPERQGQLFDAFAGERRGGSGLGLHLSKAIADAHGAQLRYEDARPGARFVLAGLAPAE